MQTSKQALQLHLPPPRTRHPMAKQLMKQMSMSLRSSKQVMVLPHQEHSLLCLEAKTATIRQQLTVDAFLSACIV